MENSFNIVTIAIIFLKKLNIFYLYKIQIKNI